MSRKRKRTRIVWMDPNSLNIVKRRRDTYRDNTVHLQVDYIQITSGLTLNPKINGLNMESKNVILVAIDKSEQSEDAFKCEYMYVCSWGRGGIGGGVV